MSYKRFGFGFAIAAAVAMVGMSASAAERAKTADGKPILTICSGVEGGGYYSNADKIAGAVARYARMDNSYSAGSVENLERLAGIVPGKQCDFLELQADAVAAKKKDIPNLGALFSEVRKMYPEVVYVITTAKGGITKFDELVGSGKKIAVVGGSGAEVTLNAIGTLEPKYKVGTAFGVETADDWDHALDMLKDGKVQAVFYVAGVNPNNAFLKKVSAKKDQFFLAHLQNDKLESSGYYEPKKLSNSTFPNLQGFWDTRTIAVESILAVNKATEAELKDQPFYKALRNAISGKVDEIRGENFNEKVLKPL